MSFLKAKVNPKTLATILSQVCKAASTKGTIPVLSAVRIQGVGNGLMVSATNMEIYLERRVPAVVYSIGDDQTVVVPARRLAQILKLVPKNVDTIHIEGCGHRERPFLAVVWEDSRYILHGFDPSMFPAKHELADEAFSFTIETSQLQVLLKRTLWAAGHDESKPWLTGVQLQVDAESLKAVATDGVCIAWASCEALGGPAEGAYRIIPQATIKLLLVLLPTVTEAAIDIVYDDQRFIVWAGDLQLVSRTFEGQYPDVMRLVPTSWPMHLSIPRYPMLEAIQRLAVIAKDGAFKMEMHPAKLLTLTTQTPEVGEALERIPNTSAPDELTTAFNSAFFIKFLPLWQDERLVCSLSGSRNPVQFKPEATDEDYGAVILPLITF